MVVHAQFVKQNTKLLQVLTKQEEGDMATSKDQLLQRLPKRLPGVDTVHVEISVELWEGKI
jgi:hypothetical protein